MPRLIGSCPLCHSDAFYRRGRVVCENDTCLGRSDSEIALERARDRFARGETSAEEMEREVERALTDPPVAFRDHLVFR